MADEGGNPARSARAFPPPWIAVEVANGFRIDDAHGHAVAWTYFSDAHEPAEGDGAMTRAEAQRIAKAIAMVPEMRTIIRTLQDGLAEADADTD